MPNPAPKPLSGADPLSAGLLADLDRCEREATPAPWCWDLRGDKDADIQIGVAFLNDKPIAGYFDEEDAVYIDPVAQDVANATDAALIVKLRNSAPALIASARRITELEARLDMAEKLAAEQLAIEAVLAPYKEREGSYYDAACRLDKRVEELEYALRSILGTQPRHGTVYELCRAALTRPTDSGDEKR